MTPPTDQSPPAMTRQIDDRRDDDRQARAEPPRAERVIEKEIRYQKPSLLGRLVVGMLSNLGVTMMISWIPFWSVIPVVGAALLWLIFGWKVTPPATIAGQAAPIERRVESGIDRLSGHVGDLAGQAASRIPFFGHKSPEQLRIEAEQKEAKRIREAEAERNTLRARAESIGVTYDDSWTLEKLRIEVQTAEKLKSDDRERNLLANRADKLALEIDPAWDTATLRERVKAEEERLRLDADHQARLRAWKRAVERWEWERLHGVNALCPEPKCHHPLRLGAGRAGGGFVCPKCNGTFPCSRAWAMFKTPPRPREPLPIPPKKGLLNRVSGFIFG